MERKLFLVRPHGERDLDQSEWVTIPDEGRMLIGVALQENGEKGWETVDLFIHSDLQDKEDEILQSEPTVGAIAFVDSSLLATLAQPIAG